MPDCTPAALAELAACLTGLSPAQQQAIQTYLLCQISNAAAPVVPAPSYYTIPIIMPGASAPADNTTYFFGADVAAAGTAFSTMITYGVSSIVIPVAGTIVAYSLKARIRTAIGSAENASHSIRVNDSVDVGTTNMSYAAATQSINVTGLSQAVAANDTLALKIVAPLNWVTNPTGVTWMGLVTIRVAA